MGSSRNFAPRLPTCSFTAGRTSKADTTAPRRRAVAIAWSPATPAPSTSTRAGGSVPAAVTSIGKNRPAAAAARRTALYPATVAWDDSTSMGCARVMRGSNARLKPATWRDASSATTCRSAEGWNRATSAARSRHNRASSVAGGCTLRTTSLCPNTSAAVATTDAPAARYASSPNDAASPAARSTSTAKPDFASRPATSGVNATRRSLAAVSFGTPIFMSGFRERRPLPRLRQQPLREVEPLGELAHLRLHRLHAILEVFHAPVGRWRPRPRPPPPPPPPDFPARDAQAVAVPKVADCDQDDVVQVPDPEPAQREEHPDRALPPTRVESV